MIPSISLDFNDVAKRIDSFIETDYLFKLFEPEDVIEIIKRTEFNFQRFVTFIKHMRSFYDENIVIKFLLEIKEVLPTDNKQNLEIIKIILETIDIPALTNIYSHITKPKSRNLSLCCEIFSFETDSDDTKTQSNLNQISHEKDLNNTNDKTNVNETNSQNEHDPITFGETQLSERFIIRNNIATIIRFINQDKELATVLLENLTAEEIQNILPIIALNNLRFTAKFILDFITKNKIKIDFHDIIVRLIAAGNLEAIKIFVDYEKDISFMAKKAFVWGHLHIIKYFLNQYPDLMKRQQHLKEIALEENHYAVLDCFDNINDGDYRPKTITQSIKDAYSNYAGETSLPWHGALIYNDMEYLKTLIYQCNMSLYKFLVIQVLNSAYKILDKLLQQNFILAALTRKKKEKLMKYSFIASVETIQTVFKYLYEPATYDHYNVLFDIWEYNQSTVFLQLYEQIKFSICDLIFIARLNRTGKTTEAIIHDLINETIVFSDVIPKISVGCFNERKFVKSTNESKLGQVISSEDDLLFFFACIVGNNIMKKFPSYLHIATSNDLDALCLACRSGKINNVETLINLGFNVNEANINGVRPIHIACKYGHHDLVQFLSDHNCDLNACNSEGHNAMDYAVVGGYHKIIKTLIEKGIKIDKEFCIAHGHYQSLKYLIENGYITKDDIKSSKIHDPNRMTVFNLLQII